MSSSSSLTNDEIKHRILNVYAKFVTDVEPDRVSDWLVQEHVITVEQWQKIRHENPSIPNRCRALLSHLFSTQHPRAFIVVRKSLSSEDHYLLEDIDNQESESVVFEEPEKQHVLQEKNKTQLLEKANDDQRRAMEAGKDPLLQIQKENNDQKTAWEAEKNRLLQIQKEYERQKLAWEAEKDHLLKIQKEHNDHKTAWEAEKNRLLQIQKEHEHQKLAWEAEKDLLLKIQKEHNDQKSAWEAEKNRLLQMQKEHEHQKSAWKDEKDSQPNIQKELETGLYLRVTEEQQSSLEHESKVSPREKDRFVREVEELKQTQEVFGNDHKSDPVLVQTIITNTSRNGRGISGLAILENELFIVSEESSEIDVYDLIKFSLSRQWSLEELVLPKDIASCDRNKCLYIFDFKAIGLSNEILKVDSNGKLLKKWSVGDDFSRLSVAYDSNIIATVYNKNILSEYSPDGQLVREIKLSPDPGIRGPLQAIKQTNGHFVVSLGYLYGDDLHRVWIVDVDGELKKSFVGECISSLGQMDYPITLSIDGNGLVMIADRNSGRVLLLDSDLEFKREILSKEVHELQGPSRILLDESNVRLIVADISVINGGGRIMIFKI